MEWNAPAGTTSQAFGIFEEVVILRIWDWMAVGGHCTGSSQCNAERDESVSDGVIGSIERGCPSTAMGQKKWAIRP